MAEALRVFLQYIFLASNYLKQKRNTKFNPPAFLIHPVFWLKAFVILVQGFSSIPLKRTKNRFLNGYKVEIRKMKTVNFYEGLRLKIVLSICKLNL